MNRNLKRTGTASTVSGALAACLFFAAGFWTAGALRADAGIPSDAQPATAGAPGIVAPAYSTMPRPEITRLPGVPPTDPQTVADLKAIQTRVEAVVKAAIPAVVSIQFPFAQGSGVLVSQDGIILTAGHVSGTPGQVMHIVLADGRRVWGKALGANNGIDSGMIKITTPGTYPFVPVGSARKLVSGQWVVAMGHPGGYVRDRPPVVRLGRVLLANYRLIGTDSPLISGDSGGPLFDLDGRLIGINSRIGPTTTANIHVPIDTFLDTWTQLAKGEEWGGGISDALASRGAILGIHAMFDEKGAKVSLVRPNTPAAHAGILQGDIITMFNGKAVKDPEDLADDVSEKRPGQSITLNVLRDAKPIELQVRLGGVRHRSR